MENRINITIKGRATRGSYDTTLADLFRGSRNNVLSRPEADVELRSFARFLPGLSSGLLDEVFPQAFPDQGRSYARYPCAMKDAPESKVLLNLAYQDTRLKLAVEDKMAGAGSPVMEAEARSLLQIYALLLRTSLRGPDPVWRHCTDNDLDALTFLLSDRYDPSRKDLLLREGHLSNQNSLAALKAPNSKAVLPPDRFLAYQIHAGTVWWNEDPPHRVSEAPLVINDYESFAAEALRGTARLAFLFDDNGELVWDLLMVQKLLQASPGLTVTGVVSTEVVANNANMATLRNVIDDGMFEPLRNHPRFRVFGERNISSSIDLSLCSLDLLNLLRGSDCVFIKGVSFFQTMQGLERPSYYGFVVHSEDSQRCTGFNKGDGIFVRLPGSQAGFEYGKTCLKDLYPV